MGWLDFLKRKPAEGASPSLPPSASAPPPPIASGANADVPRPPALERLLAREGPALSEDEALACLQALRQSPYEGVGLETLLRRGRGEILGDRLTVAIAAALADRGDGPRALTLLETSRSTAGLVLRADILESRGDLPRAVAVLERAL